MRVAVLGATGLLGHTVAHYLSNNGFDVVAYSRDIDKAQKILPNVRHGSLRGFLFFLTRKYEEARFDYTINCIVVKNPVANAEGLEEAVTWNTRMVHDLANNRFFGKIVHISTDAVFPKRDGIYNEDAPHECSDIYSMTKSLSEIPHPNVMTLRCSIIGHEPIKRANPSILEWFLKQKRSVHGYLNHKWNGVTALQFAQICETIMKDDLYFHGQVQHIVPADWVHKYDLLHLFKKAYKKKIEIVPKNAAFYVERLLYTQNPTDHSFLWNHKPKTIAHMVADMCEYNAKFGV